MTETYNADSDVYRAKVDEIDAHATGLTKWETRFIGQLVDKDWKMFTPRQKAIIDKIYEERMA